MSRPSRIRRRHCLCRLVRQYNTVLRRRICARARWKNTRRLPGLASRARCRTGSTAEAEAEVERALLPACERTSLAEELDVTMKSNSRREPHDLFARTQIRTRSASLDAVSSSVDPNDIMSPLASPASPRGCRNGATSMDVEGALIQSIDTDTLHGGIPTAPLSSHTPRRSLSHEGAGTQPLSRSDSAHRVPRS